MSLREFLSKVFSNIVKKGIGKKDCEESSEGCYRINQFLLTIYTGR